MEIVPAILEETFSALERRLEDVQGVAHTLQLDVCDGNFVPSITWPYITPPHDGKSFNYDEHFLAVLTEEREMPYWESFDFELDLMVADPIRLLPDLLRLGPASVVFHLPLDEKLVDTLYALRELMPGMVSLGLAVPAQTDSEKIKQIVDEGLISFVQVMGIEKIGFQGQPFSTHAIDTVRTIHTAYPELPISVDGGVNIDTADSLREAGATTLIVGSAFWEAENKVDTLKALGA